MSEDVTNMSMSTDAADTSMNAELSSAYLYTQDLPSSVTAQAVLHSSFAEDSVTSQESDAGAEIEASQAPYRPDSPPYDPP